MKVTRQMTLAYEVDMLWSAISKDPRFKQGKNSKAAYFPVIRYGCDNEMDKIAEYKDDYDNAKTEQDKIKVLQSAAQTLGTDGAKYRTSEHSNNNLIPGQNYMFFFVIKSKEDIARALICIKDVRNASQRLLVDENYTYSTAAFAFPATKEMRAKKFEGTYGRVWGDYCLSEIHLPVEEFDPDFLIPNSIIPDLATWQDNYYRENDLELLIERQKSALLGKDNPLNFKKLKQYIDTDSHYPSTYSQVADLYSTYFADVEEDDEEVIYDEEPERQEDENPTLKVDSEEDFQDSEIMDIVVGVLSNPTYTNAQRREILDYYGKTFGTTNQIAAMAERYNFTITPPQNKKEEKTPPQEQ